jgi:hypothetical protein
LLKSSHGSEDEGLLKGKLVIGTQKSKALYGGPNNPTMCHHVAKVIYLRPE